MYLFFRISLEMTGVRADLKGNSLPPIQLELQRSVLLHSGDFARQNVNGIPAFARETKTDADCFASPVYAREEELVVGAHIGDSAD